MAARRRFVAAWWPHLIRLAFLAVLAASQADDLQAPHADDLQACIEASASDEVCLMQKLPRGRLSVEAGISRKQRTPSFAAFVQQHSRAYAEGTPEYERRRLIFERRAMEAESLNQRPMRLWTAGVNHLSDWTDEELSRLHGRKGMASRRSNAHGTSHAGDLSFIQTAASVLDDEVSWVHLNASRAVHDQGSCGSCWALASALILEANHEIHQKTRRTFSAQELVDCVENTHHCGGAGGCSGATVELAMDYTIRHGLDDTVAAPYAAHDGWCSKDLSLLGGEGDTNVDDLERTIAVGLHSASETSKGLLAFGMTGWEHLPENKYEPLMRAVTEHGPVAVSVAASAWTSYVHGIFDGCSADAVINHAVTLMGFGQDHDLKAKFWLIQNSWGFRWGEQGRIRILRRHDDETHCGTDWQPQDGTACDGGPAQVTVCGMCGILYDSVVPHFSKVD